MPTRIAAVVLFLIVGASPLLARPLLEHASPASGNTLRQAPSYIALSFTEVLLPRGSDAVLRKATGGGVSSGKARVTSNQLKVEVPANSVPPGKYRVEWVATSSDKRQNQGSFTFIVGGKDTAARSSVPKSRVAHDRHHETKLGRAQGVISEGLVNDAPVGWRLPV